MLMYPKIAREKIVDAAASLPRRRMTTIAKAGI
jgi:hypothetical protein